MTRHIQEPTIVYSVRVPLDVDKALRKTARKENAPRSTIAAELLIAAVRAQAAGR